MAPDPTILLGLRDEVASVGDHIAYFWETPREFQDGVRFLEVGLNVGDFCVIFGHDEGNRRVREVLVERGYNCERLETKGQLVTVPGHLDATQMLSNIGQVFSTAIADGAKLIRLLGNIGWGHDGWPNEKDILEFEARVTGAAKQFPCIVVCMYDVRALPGRVMVHGAFETHPLTFCGNVMRQNTHYVEVDEFLSRLRRTDQESIAVAQPSYQPPWIGGCTRHRQRSRTICRAPNFGIDRKLDNGSPRG